jgi:hypothetical protein
MVILSLPYVKSLRNASVEGIQQSYITCKLRIFQGSIHNFIRFDPISVTLFH